MIKSGKPQDLACFSLKKGVIRKKIIAGKKGIGITSPGNNAGKSTILIAISLFFSGSSLTSSDFFSAENEISIEIVSAFILIVSIDIFTE